jgi:hypothetical protein
VAFKTAVGAEIQKLGVTGTSRVTAIEEFLRGQIGDTHAGALRSMVVPGSCSSMWLIRAVFRQGAIVVEHEQAQHR